MIRINLLPVPKARKQEKIIIEAIVAVAAVALVAVACWLYAGTKEAQIQEATLANTNIQNQIAELKAKVGEVEKFKQKLRSLQEQIDVIKKLESGRSGPVRMLDELTSMVPRKLWIDSFKESAGKVTMQGTASDGPVIADFLENLKRSQFFVNPQLQVVSGAGDSKADGLQKFTINVEVKYGL